VSYNKRLDAYRAPKQVSVYVSVRKTATAVELSHQRSIWTRVASATLRPEDRECTLRFTPTDAACLIVEFTDLHERREPEHLKCPRCGSAITQRHGTCANCNENAYQCRSCRYIPYNDPDGYLCLRCGRSRDISYDIRVVSEPGFVAPPVETEQDFDAAQEALAKVNEEAADSIKKLEVVSRLARSSLP